MAYDENLAARVRTVSSDEFTEKKMFGGLAFMREGHMCFGIVDRELMVRIGPDQYEHALSLPHVRPMDFTGKPLKGMVYVAPAGIKTAKTLRAWIDRAVAFASSLPAKSASSKRSARTEKTAFNGFPEETFRFLRGIRKHNDKVWFESHRSDYDAGYVDPAKAFIATLGPRLRKISKTVNFDPKINGSIFRINRDVRFSKDKTPYKDHLDLWFWHGERRGWGTPGFFFRMFADRLILGAGMHAFEKPQLESYRQAVIAPKSGKALVAAIEEVRAAGDYEIGGASRAKVPRGFDPDHERADLLLHEGLWAELDRKIEDEPRRSDFVEVCAEHFGRVFPIARWLLRELA